MAAAGGGVQTTVSLVQATVSYPAAVAAAAVIIITIIVTDIRGSSGCGIRVNVCGRGCDIGGGCGGCG